MTIGLGVAAAPLVHDDRQLAVVGAGEGGGGGEFAGAGATELEVVELGGGDAEDLADLVDVAALVLMCVALPMGFLHEANKQKQEWARLRRASR